MPEQHKLARELRRLFNHSNPYESLKKMHEAADELDRLKAENERLEPLMATAGTPSAGLAPDKVDELVCIATGAKCATRPRLAMKGLCDCTTCAAWLEHRTTKMALGTAETMHAAWRKRADEAEAKLAARLARHGPMTADRMADELDRLHAIVKPLLDRDPALVERVARAIHNVMLERGVSYYPEGEAREALTAILTPPEAEKMKSMCPRCHDHPAVPCLECSREPPPPAGEIGPEWLPPGIEPSGIGQTSDGMVRMDRRDAEWRSALRAERAARIAAERERDESRAREVLVLDQMNNSLNDADKEVADLRTACERALSRASTAEAKLADREAELLRVRTTAHGAAHQLDNIAIEQGWGAGLSPDGIAANIRNCLKARTAAESTLAALRDPDAGMVEACGFALVTANLSGSPATVRKVLATALAHAGEKPKGETGESEQTKRLRAVIRYDDAEAAHNGLKQEAMELSRRLDKLEARRSP